MTASKRRKKIKILLAEDHPLVRQWLRACLEAQGHLRVVGEAADGLEVVRKARALAPDIVLMDVTMPRMNGIEATRRLGTAAPKARVIAFTMHQDQEYVLGMRQAGARGYVLKDAPQRELLRAIEAVYGGGTFFRGVAAWAPRLPLLEKP